MKHKTTLLTIFLCGTLLWGGCGNAENTSQPSADQTTSIEATPVAATEAPAVVVTDTPTATEAPAITETPAASATQEPAPESTPVATIAPTKAPAEGAAPILSIQVEEKEWYADYADYLLFSAGDFTVSLGNGGFDALEKTLAQLHPGLREEQYTTQIQLAQDTYYNMAQNDFGGFWGYSSHTSAEVARCDSSIVSLRIFTSEYAGGAHDIYVYYGETFDAQTGEQLELTDILADAEGFYAKATEYIADELYKYYSDGLEPNYREYVADTFSPERNLLWYLNGSGIVIVYSTYEIGPYAMGCPEVTLPYSEFGCFMHEKYLAPQGEVVAQISANQDISTLIGASEPVMVEVADNEWYMSDINILAGSAKEEVGSFSSFDTGYVIKRMDGRSFLILSSDYMSDDYVTLVHEITDGVIRKCVETPYLALNQGLVSTDRISMMYHLDVLGSYACTMDYILTEEGQLVQSEEFFTINTTNPLTLIKELPVTIGGIETTLSEGTQILLTGTNDIDEVQFRVVGSDQIGSLYYTLDPENVWLHLIDGIDEHEYFSVLPYAG